MKAWQIFAVGTTALVLALLLPSYESALAGVGAFVIVVVVVVGFAVHPRKDVFYIRTTNLIFDPDYRTSVEHDRIAVRVEIARLWLLFIPTFGAVAFLLLTFTRGTTWKFSLWNSGFLFFEVRVGPYPVFLFCRILFLVILGLLSTWVSERWVLRDADACSARSISSLEGRILYSFRDRAGGYYGGEGFAWGVVRAHQLKTIVLYNVARPHLNKIAMCCLFHRLVIIGRGLTDLGEATVDTNAPTVPAATQSLWVPAKLALKPRAEPGQRLITR
jgi:hypothetical protein